jgi:hypothetical protein
MSLLIRVFSRRWLSGRAAFPDGGTAGAAVQPEFATALSGPARMVF